MASVARFVTPRAARVPGHAAARRALAVFTPSSSGTRASRIGPSRTPARIAARSSAAGSRSAARSTSHTTGHRRASSPSPPLRRLGRLRERHVFGLAKPSDDEPLGRRLSFRGNDERPALGAQVDACVEEPLRVGIPRGQLDACLLPLGEHDVAPEARLVGGGHGTECILGDMGIALADAHCHLDAGYFPEGADAVMDRAAAAGVVGFVVVGVGKDLGPARAAVALARRSPERVCACVGVHPHDASTWSDDVHAELCQLALGPEVIAVGEIGLDYHYDHSPRDVQKSVFARLIGLAREVRKPIVVHTRSAPADTLDILESEGAREVGGIIHCFSEDRPFAARALDLGFDISISGIVTFKNARSVHDVAAWAPSRSRAGRDR